MEGNIDAPTLSTGMPALLALEDFGELQARYQELGLAKRAQTVLVDAGPVLQTVECILSQLAARSDIGAVFASIRNNPALTGKMRASQAKTVLLDDGNDFIATTRQKLSAWQKAMERIGQGEGVLKENGKEYIPGTESVAMALFSAGTVDAYLSVIQLALAELGKREAKKASEHQSNMGKIRRCATLIADYDNASSIRAMIH